MAPGLHKPKWHPKHLRKEKSCLQGTALQWSILAQLCNVIGTGLVKVSVIGPADNCHFLAVHSSSSFDTSYISNRDPFYDSPASTRDSRHYARASCVLRTVLPSRRRNPHSPLRSTSVFNSSPHFVLFFHLVDVYTSRIPASRRTTLPISPALLPQLP